MDLMNLEHSVVTCLLKSGLTLATAESCSGGLLAHRLTNVPGASGCFVGGIIAYSNRVKIDLLGLEEIIITKYGAVSDLAALQMAKGVRRLLHSDWSVGITGIAGPSGGTEKKPVGTVYLAVCGPSHEITEHHVFDGDRDSVKYQTTNRALEILWEKIR